MNPDYVLILSAGMGTRMGLIGKHLPKPLWPIYEKTLLEIQLDYIKKYSPKQIFVNVHHGQKLITELIKECKCKVNVLYESTLLGVGGAIHNVKKLQTKGRLLVINSDQLYLMSENDEACFWKKSLACGQTLLTVKVDKTSNYNKLLLGNNDSLVDIKRDCAELELTYSGISIIDLGSLNYTPGFSNFFDTVANYKKDYVSTYLPVDQSEYWDFGTLKQYIESVKTIANQWNSPMLKRLRSVLLEANAIKPKHLSRCAYRGTSPGYFNFSNIDQAEMPNVFILGNVHKKTFTENHLYYQDLEMSLDC